MRQVNSHCEEPAHVRSGRVTLTARRELPFFPDQRTSPIRCASGPKSAMSGSPTFPCRLVVHAGWDVIRAAQLSAIPPRIAPDLRHVDKGQERG
jgi:hypothetical protein